jgi:hypothetical protein
MTVIARDDVTLALVTDVASTAHYFQLKSSTASAPTAPTVYPAPSPWVTTEPTYMEGATNSLYAVDVTVFSDGSFDYTPVSLSSSYEAAKAAYNKAQQAQSSATSAQTAANLALANAQELIRNPTMRSDVSNPDGWPGNVTLGASGAPSTPPTPFTTYAKVTGRDHFASWTLPNIPGRVLQYTIYAVADSTATNALQFGVQYCDSNGTMHWPLVICATVEKGQSGWAKYVGTWTVPDNISSDTNLPRPWLEIDTFASDSGWYVTGLSIKDTAVFSAAQTTADTAQTIASAAQSAASAAQSSAKQAQSTATSAQTTADGKNKIFSSASEPSHVGIVPGDMWFQLDSNQNVSGIKVWNGSAFTDMVLVANKLLVASSVGTTQIADNAIVTGKIAANAITAESGVIADAAITNAKIASLDAGKITTGYVDAARIAAGSITADKLLVGGGGDYSPNPTFDPSGPLLGKPHSWIPGNRGHSVQLTDRGNTFPASTAFPVSKGDVFYITCEATHQSGTAPLSLGLWWDVTPSTATSISPWTNLTLATDLGQSANNPDWHKYAATISVPTASDAVAYTARGYIMMDVGLNGKETVAQNTWLIGNYHIYKVSDETLIQDGSISTNKLVANAVTGDKIAANSVTAAKIAAQSITGDKLDVGSVAAAIVTSNLFKTSGTSDYTTVNDSGVTVYKDGKPYTHLGSDTSYGLQVWNPINNAMADVSPQIFGAKTAFQTNDITTTQVAMTSDGSKWTSWTDATTPVLSATSPTGRFMIQWSAYYTGKAADDFVAEQVNINVTNMPYSPLRWSWDSGDLHASFEPAAGAMAGTGYVKAFPGMAVASLTPGVTYDFYFSFRSLHYKYTGQSKFWAYGHCDRRFILVTPI